MILAYRSALFLLVLAACSPGPKGDTTDTGSSTTGTTAPGSGTDGMSSTDAPTTAPTTDAPTTDALGTTGVPGTSTDTGTTADDTDTTAGPISGISTLETSSTTDHGFVCDLVELTFDHAHQLGGPVQDCGIVDPWNNTTEEWQAARDCALAAAAAEQQFQLVTWLQGFDSSVGRGYVGVAARSFALEVIHFDSLGEPVALSEPCASLAAVDGCVVGPGAACLECVDSPGTVLLCDFD